MQIASAITTPFILGSGWLFCRSRNRTLGVALCLFLAAASCGLSQPPEDGTASQPAAPKLSQDELNRGLLEASALGDLPRAASLLKDGADPNAVNPDGVSPLMIAAGLGQSPMAQALIGAGAKVNGLTTKQRSSPLMFAASFGHLEVATILLQAGADVGAVDASNHTPVDYTIMPNDGETQDDVSQKVEVGKLLVSKGGKLTLTQDNFLGRLLSTTDANVLSDLMERAKTGKFDQPGKSDAP